MFDKAAVGVDGRSGGRDAIALAGYLAAAPSGIVLAHVDSPSRRGATRRRDHGGRRSASVMTVRPRATWPSPPRVSSCAATTRRSGC